MRKIFIVLLTCANMLALSAQQAKIDIKENPNLSASNLVAYPGPLQQKLTDAPKGYHPFYISHYSRHGSRYLTGEDDYTKPLETLMCADSLGKLSVKGEEVLEKVKMIAKEATNRYGDLTQLGAEQHKAIAKRMFERFPEVFAGKTPIDAKSTVSLRSILSMQNALHQLIALNPELQVKHDASPHDMYYMNADRSAIKLRMQSKTTKRAYDDFCDHHQINYRRVIEPLFSDTIYMLKNVKLSKLGNQLFKLAGSIQNTELRHQINLYELFTTDEIYDLWLQKNAHWYTHNGPCPLNGNIAPFFQRQLLRKMIEEADSCMAYEHPGASLRYGHDLNVMPLVCLLELDNFGEKIEDLEQLAYKDWNNYRVIPMACNVQFIFYRKSPSDKDIIFKVLLNENEALLPLQSKAPPYYKWSDFKKYFIHKLDSFQE